MANKLKIEQRQAYAYEYDLIASLGVRTNMDNFLKFRFLRLFTVLFISLALCTSLIIQTCKETKFSVIIGNSYYTISQLTYILKLFNYMYNLPKIYKIDKIFQEEMFNSYTETQHRFIVKAVTIPNLLAKTYRYLIVFWLVLYLIFPFVDGGLLALPGWYPIDVIKYRWLIIIYQIISIGLSALINSSMDIITIGFVSVATAHFSIVKDKLMGIQKGEDPAEVKKKIASCCYYHNRTIDIAKQIEDAFSYGIFMQFITSILVICITFFEMLLVSQYSVEYVMLVSYLLLITLQITLYCVFGHDIMLKSEEVLDACYMSEWNEYDSSVRKMLFIIMERAKRPIKLTAGKVFFLNIPTLVNILRSAYSYFAILRQVYNDSKE